MFALAEIGHFTLILALVVSVIQALLPLFPTKTGLFHLKVPLQLSASLLVFFAFGCLVYGFITSDFSLSLVAQHSHTAKPFIYKISGTWGNHEGSLLLWIVILVLFGGIFALTCKSVAPRLSLLTLSVQGVVTSSFLAFSLFTSNPFLRLADAPLEGRGLNPVLQDVSFTAEVGQTIALVGPSGAGKTSILNLILRFFDNGKGHISINGVSIKDMKLSALRAMTGLVSQDAVLFDDTIEANIRFGRQDATDEEVLAAAKAAAADTFITSLPDGYQTNVGAFGQRLSGGQKQRIAIARAMLKDAPLLLLDEATSALDADSERQVQDALERLKQGRTSLVVAHRLSTVKNADLILVMDAGEIVERGTHSDLMQRDGLYARLVSLQQLAD